jgi:hypothetical protein
MEFFAFGDVETAGRQLVTCYQRECNVTATQVGATRFEPMLVNLLRSHRPNSRVDESSTTAWTFRRSLGGESRECGGQRQGHDALERKRSAVGVVAIVDSTTCGRG